MVDAFQSKDTTLTVDAGNGVYFPLLNTGFTINPNSTIETLNVLDRNDAVVFYNSQSPSLELATVYDTDKSDAGEMLKQVSQKGNFLIEYPAGTSGSTGKAWTYGGVLFGNITLNAPYDSLITIDGSLGSGEVWQYGALSGSKTIPTAMAAVATPTGMKTFVVHVTEVGSAVETDTTAAGYVAASIRKGTSAALTFVPRTGLYAVTGLADGDLMRVQFSASGNNKYIKIEYGFVA